MSAKLVEVDDITYHTLLERPAGVPDDARIILLSHALMSNLHMWDATARALNDAGYTTLRFDLVGHGLSPAPREDVNLHLDDITRHMLHIVKAVTGRDKIFAVIGCSISGVLAMRYAMTYPSAVQVVVSVAAPPMTAPHAAKELWSQRVAQFEEDTHDGKDTLCRQTVQRWFPGQRVEDEAARDRSLEHTRTCTLRGYRILANAIRNYDYAGEIAGIGNNIRCLIVAGAEDSSAPADGLEALSKEVGGAQFVVMPETGHLAPMQRPEEFNAHLLAFISACNSDKD